jgi:glycosyltransferase involved in cell wall biosynthesis
MSQRVSAGSVARADEPLAVCTIISKNYLAQARTLAESLERESPGVRLFVLVVDRIENRFERSREPFEVVELDELAIPRWQRLCFRYSVLELCTAVKPTWLRYLLERRGISRLAYLDPDILVLDTLGPLAELLSRASVILTPHLTEPLPLDGQTPTEINILQAGTYNLGFIALRAGATATRLLTWWEERLATACRVDVEHGLFVDQKWIDLVPGYFEDVLVLREPGYNVAYWNLSQRVLTQRDGRWLSNGEPCYFFHFSGYDPRRPQMLSTHQDRLEPVHLREATALFDAYRERLLANGFEESIQWPYSFDAFDNGFPILDAMRRTYAELKDPDRFGDPFETSSPNSFFPWVTQGDLPDKTASAAEPECSSRTPPALVGLPKRTLGVNVAGYFRSEKGVGEGVRALLKALEAAGIPFVLNDVTDSRSENRHEVAQPFCEQNPYSISLLHINADQVPGFAQARGPDYFRDRHTIAVWNWELATFPRPFHESFNYVDEIWCPSTFTQRAVAAATLLPVHCVPYAIMVPDCCCGAERRTLGLPENAFVFLFAFDFTSGIQRKNPFAVVEAFQKAFGNRADVHLVLKATHGNTEPQALDRLRRTCAGCGNVSFLDAVLDRERMWALVAACDAVVSLHRSEGFGLLLAEAMALGKPTIATAYSANSDFMTTENSLLVNYRLVKNHIEWGPYARGALWADPNVNHAAALMRRLVDEPDLRERLGKRARQDMAQSHSQQRIGEIIRTRLDAILSDGERPSRATAHFATARDMQRFADVVREFAVDWPRPVRSSRRLVGPLIDRLRTALLRLLRPFLLPQAALCQALYATLANLQQSIRDQQRLLIDSKRSLSGVPASTPVTGPSEDSSASASSPDFRSNDDRRAA